VAHVQPSFSLSLSLEREREVNRTKVTRGAKCVHTYRRDKYYTVEQPQGRQSDRVRQDACWMGKMGDRVERHPPLPPSRTAARYVEDRAVSKDTSYTNSLSLERGERDASRLLGLARIT